MVIKQSKKLAKKQQILEAAIQLFTEHGYAATSMDIIAKTADVSKQTVYSHFGSKDELFSASIVYKCESLHIFDLDMENIDNPKTILLNLAQRFTDIITSKQACSIHKICAFESNAYPQVSDIFYQSGPLRVTNQVALLMEKLDEKKLLSIDNPRYAAIQFLNMVKGEIWMQVEFNTKERISAQEVKKFLQHSVEFFMRGYQRQKH